MKWVYLAAAIVAAIIAGLSVLPYGWAHLTVTAFGAASGAFMGSGFVTLAYKDWRNGKP